MQFKFKVRFVATVVALVFFSISNTYADVVNRQKHKVKRDTTYSTRGHFDTRRINVGKFSKSSKLPVRYLTQGTDTLAKIPDSLNFMAHNLKEGHVMEVTLVYEPNLIGERKVVKADVGKDTIKLLSSSTVSVGYAQDKIFYVILVSLFGVLSIAFLIRDWAAEKAEGKSAQKQT